MRDIEKLGYTYDDFKLPNPGRTKEEKSLLFKEYLLKKYKPNRGEVYYLLYFKKVHKTILGQPYSIRVFIGLESPYTSVSSPYYAGRVTVFARNSECEGCEKSNVVRFVHILV